MRRCAVPLSLFLAITFVLSVGCSWNPYPYKAEQERVLSAPYASASGLSVRTMNGQITIESDVSRPDIQITATIRAAGETPDEADSRVDLVDVVALRRDDGVLDVSVVFPGERRGNEGCHFHIVVPEASGVFAKSSNGKIKIRGLGGFADLDTSNGTIEVTDHTGDLKADTSNGRLVLTHVSGEVNASTSNGSITATGIEGVSKLKTSNGGISFAPAAGSSAPFDLGTSNGSITITLDAGFAGTINARTSNASITAGGDGAVLAITGDKRSKQIRVNDGGTDSFARTSNGKIKVRVGETGG